MQIAFMKWLQLAHPDVWLDTYASAGGLKTTAASARLMKAMGYKAGTPDIFIAVSNKAYPGLYLELKAENTTQPKGSKSQRDVLKRLTARGFATAVCVGLDQAIHTVETYLRGGRF